MTFSELGMDARQALIRALERFDGMIDDLMQTAPEDLLEHGAMG